MTPPNRASLWRWTSTAIEPTSPWASRTAAAELTTRWVASTNASHPTTSSTEVKRPAIDDSPMSSMTDDDRTTSGPVEPAHRCSYARRTSSATLGSSRPARTPAVVMTNPGRVAKPAAAARARFAAFAPDTEGSRVSGSESATTIGGLTLVTLRADRLGVSGQWTLMLPVARAHDEVVENDTSAGAPPSPRRRITWRRVLVAVGLVVLVVMAATFVAFRRQTISYVTHRKGGPSITWPYEVHDPPARVPPRSGRRRRRRWRPHRCDRRGCRADRGAGTLRRAAPPR